jgi:RpiB/LacA/LacB family sugar-phosphate isomerase
MAAQRSELESDIRDLVARVLNGVLDGTGRDGETGSRPSRPDPEPGGDIGRHLAIGSDHGGFELKQAIAAKLVEAGWTVDDCGTDSTEACDYPAFAHAVARRVGTGKCAVGIVIDGAGIGSAMVANKIPHVRAAACYDISTARNSREHNRANVLTLGAGLTGPALAWQIVQEFLSTPWGGDRHMRRVALISEIEELYVRTDA